jgi:hypothetical protein
LGPRGPEAVESELRRLTEFVEEDPGRLIYLETYGTPNSRSLMLNTIADLGYRLVEWTDYGRVAEAFVFEPRGPGA